MQVAVVEYVVDGDEHLTGDGGVRVKIWIVT